MLKCVNSILHNSVNILEFAIRPEREAIPSTSTSTLPFPHYWYNNYVNDYYYVYIMTTINNTVLYTGMTNDLKRRVYEHKEKFVPGFTARYNIIKLFYYEQFTMLNDALLNEKRIKGGSRRKKIALIESMNKEWKDLYYDL